MKLGIYTTAKVVVILLVSVPTVPAQNAGVQPARIATPIPALLDNWKVATAGTNASIDDARKIAEEYRPRLPKRDPFTPLVRMTCAERFALANPERVVWEDAALMALVDFGDRGSTLLVVPKVATNFPTDLAEEQIAHMSKVAAATCDALVVAAGGKPATETASCAMYISPPPALGVRQMHVHVEARTGVGAPVDDMFLQRTAAQLRVLVGGRGCF